METLAGVRAFNWTQRQDDNDFPGKDYDRIMYDIRIMPQASRESLAIFESEEFTIPTQVKGVTQINQTVRFGICL